MGGGLRMILYRVQLKKTELQGIALELQSIFQTTVIATDSSSLQVQLSEDELDVYKLDETTSTGILPELPFPLMVVVLALALMGKADVVMESGDLYQDLTIDRQLFPMKFAIKNRDKALAEDLTNFINAKRLLAHVDFY
jgi:hypothetical protein